jgi:hypothetical protein
MRILIILIALLWSLELSAQNYQVDLQLRGIVERFYVDFNQDPRIPFNISLDGLEDGLKGFQRAVDNPNKLVNYIQSNNINLNTKRGRAFRLGIISAYVWKDQSTGWDDITQIAKQNWDNLIQNNNLNIHVDAPDSTLLILDYITEWITAEKDDFATITVNQRALNSGKFPVQNGEVLIGDIVLTPARAAWIRENVNLIVLNNNEYFTFDNLHWFKLIEQ